MTSTPSLAGLFPPLPTPFDADGDVALEHLRDNIEALEREPLAGYVLGGSNGELNSLTLEERIALVRTARAAARGRLIIAGSGMESTRLTLELTRQMADVGADVALVVTPAYYKARMTGPALEQHFLSVAEGSPLPIVIYNVPANTGVDIPAASVIRLSRHPRIIGVKESGGDITKIGAMIHGARPGFQVLAGSGSYLLPTLLFGGVGAIAALANVAPRQLHRVMTLFAAGELEAARALQLSLIEPNTAVTSRFGVPGLKAALDLLGHHGGRPRPPLLPLSDDEATQLREILTRASLL
jgi:4-hydroxy-2-oxoglutarate aldolase